MKEFFKKCFLRNILEIIFSNIEKYPKIKKVFFCDDNS